MKERIANIKRYLKKKNKFILQNPATFEEKFAISITKRNTILVVTIAVFIFSLLVFAVISFTSLKKYVPGFPKKGSELYEIDRQNQIQLSKIAKKTENYDLWIANLHSILSNEDTLSLGDLNDKMAKDSGFDYKSVVFERNIIDSLLREKNKHVNADPRKSVFRDILIYGNNFELPAKGKITALKNEGIFSSKFSQLKKSIVLNSMEGKVISIVDKTMVIQHKYNLISIYENLIKIKSTVGEKIPSGKRIGEVSDSTFQFQVWYNGKSIPTEAYIDL